MTIIEALAYNSRTNLESPAPAYAWPGGYPLFYLCEDGGTLCPVCVNRELKIILDSTLAGDDKQWEVAAVDVNWEDERLQCDNCNKWIQSAYGDSSEENFIVS